MLSLTDPPSRFSYPNDSMTKRLIIGCGYLGRRVAEKWVADGHQVFALTRSHQHAEDFRQAGIRPLIGDVMSPESLPDFPEVELVLYSVGFDRNSGHSIGDVYIQGVKNISEVLPESVKRVVYISSTGVYGQTDGSWVDEQSATNPTRPGGIACLEAEQLWHQGGFGERTTVLRLAGIYGPERIPRLEQIKSGEPLSVPQDGWLNLIHVDDAVTVVDTVVMQQPNKSCYLVSDGCPVNRSEYLAEIAAILEAPPITFVSVDPTSAASQRASGTKRISHGCLVDEFNIVWQYPTYREGLASILKNP